MRSWKADFHKFRDGKIGEFFEFYDTAQAIGVATAHAAEGASPEIDGKALLQKTCARCHSI